MTAEPRDTTTAPAEDESPVTAESLIEEVSIDGMCGVY
jgi:mycofactocin precursor